MNIHWFAACAAFLVHVIISLKYLNMLRGIGNMPFLAFSGSTVSLPQQCGAACKVYKTLSGGALLGCLLIPLP